MTLDYFAFGNVVIDDIVLWDGRTVMDALGGASVHALAGMRVWSDRLGVVAVVGEAFPAHHATALTEMAVDQRGIECRAGRAMPRAWQLIEADGRRSIVFRSSADAFIRDSPPFDLIPADYLSARGAHLYWSPAPEEAPDLLARLRTAAPALRLVWEPSWLVDRSPPGGLRVALPLADLVCPDDELACQMTGAPDAPTALATMLRWGAPLVAIRMGAHGSLVGRSDGATWHVPAMPVSVIDTTGAGNAYGGGFLVGLGRGVPVAEAAAMAAVSASFTVESRGVPRLTPTTRAEAERRLAWVRAQITRR
ncbi:MAG: hypothetical protein IT340_06580 [Chloroflexi bacterium]|nr:hypothetical protein [Chloroflexota bacterium]